MAWFCKEKMEVRILTFNLGQGTFRILNDELKAKWDCDNLLDNQAEIGHMSDYIKFGGGRITKPSELKKGLVDTAALLNLENKKYIIMIDEIGR